MRLEHQLWIEPAFCLGVQVQSRRWIIVRFGPLCWGIGFLGEIPR